MKLFKLKFKIVLNILGLKIITIRLTNKAFNCTQNNGDILKCFYFLCNFRYTVFGTTVGAENVYHKI